MQARRDTGSRDMYREILFPFPCNDDFIRCAVWIRGNIALICIHYKLPPWKWNTLNETYGAIVYYFSYCFCLSLSSVPTIWVTGSLAVIHANAGNSMELWLVLYWFNLQCCRSEQKLLWEDGIHMALVLDYISVYPGPPMDAWQKVYKSLFYVPHLLMW